MVSLSGFIGLQLPHTKEIASSKELPTDQEKSLMCSWGLSNKDWQVMLFLGMQASPVSCYRSKSNLRHSFKGQVEKLITLTLNGLKSL